MSNRSPHPDRRALAAFTLVELLISVSIIALLLSILVPTLGRARELTRRATCAANLQGLSRAVATYGADYRTQLPQFSAYCGSWLWDISYLNRDYLIECGAQRRMLYCPSGLYQDLDQHWWFGGFTVSGYWWFHRRVPPGGTGWTAKPLLDPKANPDGRKYLVHLQEDLQVVTAAGATTFRTLGPGDLELAADATISSVINGQDFFGYTKGGSTQPHRTSHMDGGNPAGGSIMFLDGHVSWRDFQDMRKRAFGPEHWW
ncbi:MAG: hypothetical protein BWX88_01137 [Planctomycetes bacterium ADurb.Bin126]|nr:MAG: hypothetical protein BWX88_01137 [Planctomycetes bacterium ADurb.Bin126]HOD83253.1 type II secretion system protein [Phycisphaerae bacterium]HQL71811.1 type II secretion system protein [Phycisphaerae bacterium]